MHYATASRTSIKEKPNHHADEIHPRHFVEVCLDGFMQGVGGYDSWGSRPAPQHQLPADRAYHFGFSIQPVVRS